MRFSFLYFLKIVEIPAWQGIPVKDIFLLYHQSLTHA